MCPMYFHLLILNAIYVTFITKGCPVSAFLHLLVPDILFTSPHPSHSCQPDDREDLHPNCTVAEEAQYRALCAELIMSDRFKPCHTLAPEPFLDNCVYDMCEYNGMQRTLCDNVEAYAQACQSLGTTVSWRNETFCREFGGVDQEHTHCKNQFGKEQGISN